MEHVDKAIFDTLVKIRLYVDWMIDEVQKNCVRIILLLYTRLCLRSVKENLFSLFNRLQCTGKL